MTKTSIIGNLIAAGVVIIAASCDSSGGGAAINLCDTPDEDVNLPANIIENTFLDSDCTYHLVTTTFVKNNATLTIEEGTTIEGDEDSAALVITQNGKIEAVGTSSAPIVFTSGVPVGSRAAGNWGGIVLLGTAHINDGINDCMGNLGNCENNVEGLNPDVDEGLFGGDDELHDCGTLRYVRIEFAGAEYSEDNELNGLTVAGCGSGTDLSYIQVHRGFDDGVEFFGGNTDIDHFVITGPDDDGLDWDLGWTGTAEIFIIHHFVGLSSNPNGIEADNHPEAFDALPRSNPTVRFGTIIGDAESTQRGVHLRRGTAGTLSKLIVAGFADTGVDIDNNESFTLWPTTLSLEDSFFFDNATLGDADEDGLTDEEPELLVVGDRNNTTTTDPNFTDLTVTAPNYTSAITTAGAFGTGGGDPSSWLAGWTSFPAN